MYAFPPDIKFGIKHYWRIVPLNANKSASIILCLQLSLRRIWSFFLVPCRMDFPKEKHQCHPPKNYTQFFTWLGLHLLLLTNWYLGKYYSAFCLPFMNRQLEFKINPVKFQEWMIAFSFFILHMLVASQFILSFILSVLDVFPLIFLPLPSVNFHLLAGIQKQWTRVKTSSKRFLPKCMIADAGAMPRQNPAHVALSLPVGREWLDMLVAACTLPLMPHYLPGGILPLLRKGKVQEWG